MQTILGLTLLETLEHLARFFYIFQLMAVPDVWLKANFVSENTSAEMICFCRMAGTFLCCLAGARCCCAQTRAPSVAAQPDPPESPHAPLPAPPRHSEPALLAIRRCSRSSR